MLLLKFLIYDDKIFVDMIEPYTKLLRAECTPIPVLLPSHKFSVNQMSYQNILKISLSSPDKNNQSLRMYKDSLTKLSNMVSLNEFLEWYGRDVVLDTQKWLARTLENAFKSKQNKFNLPWDFDTNNSDKFYVSTLPETLRY